MQCLTRFPLTLGLLGLAWLLLGAAAPENVGATSVRLERYFEFIGNPHESFFQGSFLTGRDLQQEQDYLNLKPVIAST